MDPDHAPGVVRTNMQVAGMRVVLARGGIFQRQDDLTELASASLSTVAAQVKGKFLPGQPLNAEGVRECIDIIYADGWEPGQFIENPCKISTTASHKSRCFVMGTLAESLEGRPQAVGVPKGRSQASRALQRQTAPRSLDPLRRVGATVWLLVETPGGVIPQKAKLAYEGMSKKDVHFHSLRKNDGFFVKICYTFNIEQGIYIWRNRLT